MSKTPSSPGSDSAAEVASLDSGPAGVVATHDPYAALRFRDYRLFLTGGFIASLGMQMQAAAIGWEVYERTDSPWALGYVGLVQVLPVIALVLPAGHVADRLDRRRVIMCMQVVLMLASLGLAWVSFKGASVHWIYLLLLASGAARAFLWPAKSAYLPYLVPREAFSNAVTWSTGSFHLACVVGPALAGGLIAVFHGAIVVFVLDGMSTLTFFIMLSMMRHRAPARTSTEAVTLRSLGAGFGFLRRSPVVFGSITLDMFAVLMGGAVTLLPIYAKDILCVGPVGFGIMRTAPAIGALMMAFLLAYRPPIQRAGPALLWSVVGFGLATIVFGLSRSYWLSLAMLFLTGMLDNISVVIRHTLVQLLTPDEMRGRVSAINSMFIGASNELGGFESGAVAGWLTPTISVVSGGIGTLVVVLAIAMVYPQLRRYGRLGSEPG